RPRPGARPRGPRRRGRARAASRAPARGAVGRPPGRLPPRRQARPRLERPSRAPRGRPRAREGVRPHVLPRRDAGRRPGLFSRSSRAADFSGRPRPSPMTGDSMNRSFPPSLAALALVFAANPAFAVEAPKPKAPEMPPFEVAQPYPNTWYGRFGPTNCSWIDMGDGVLVIDTGATAGSIAQGKAKAPHVIGISDHIALVAGKQVFEIGVPAGNAHTAFDLYAFDASTRTVFAGDLVTTDRCPMLSDPDCDIKGWLAILERFDVLGARGLVPTRGNPMGNAAPEIEKTRRYLTSMLGFFVEKKKQNAPEARVSGELAAEQLADYCPRELSALNALSVYRRLLSDGTTRPGSAAARPAAKRRQPRPS